MLNELQLDLLKEYINIYLGKAAALLSEMAHQKVVLRAPEIELISQSDENDSFIEARKLFNHGHIVSSSMQFGPMFSGKAFLIFPAEQAKALVDVCMGEFSQAYDTNNVGLADTDFDVLKEISNIILNCVVGEFGNLLEMKLDFSLPDVELVFVSADEQYTHLKKNVHMLMLYMNFRLSEAQIDGVIIVALGIASLNMLFAKIDKILGEANA